MIQKIFFRLVLISLLVLAGRYAYETYQSMQGTNRVSLAQTLKEQDIEVREDSLSRWDRLARLVHMRQATLEAVNKRVDPEEQVGIDSISRFMKDAMIATEDRRFYEHGAIDPKGIARATYTNLIHGETLEGGSTITQQLVKNLFLSSKRIMSRKVEEGILAVRMESEFSKDEILAMYLNTTYFGNDYYGIQEAAEGYFHTRPGRLTLAQSAMLAGLPQAPSYFNPLENYSAAKRQQERVLKQMYEQGIITHNQMLDAMEEDLGFGD